MWVRIKAEGDDGSTLEVEIGDEEAGYPDRAHEIVRRALELWHGVASE